MSLFFSGAVTSSPIKQRLRSNVSWNSLDESFLSSDSSYLCYTSDVDKSPCCCRRSPRLLTNGYYHVTEDSFCRDHDGNVSLTPCKTKVSYKENLVRVFRRKRKPRSSLARLFTDVTESCQSWLDETVFRGMFGVGSNQNQHQVQDGERERSQNWLIPDRSSTELLDESCSELNFSSAAGVCGEVDLSFTYDHMEAPPPCDTKALPSTTLIQEDICSEIIQSQQVFPQSLGGLSEVPPSCVFYTNPCCCGSNVATPKNSGTMMKAFLLLIFTVFILTALYSRCLWWSTTVVLSLFVVTTTCMLVLKVGPAGEWRRAKTEDITSRNE